MVRGPQDGVGARALGPDRNDRAGMLLAGRSVRQVDAASGAVGHAHDLAVLGGQIVGVAGRIAGARAVFGNDLARVGMVGRHDDQRVRVVLLILQRDADRTIERDRLADLGAVSPVVDGRTIPLQPATAFAQGKFQKIPVINGSNHDEYRLFTGLQRGLLHAPALTKKQYYADLKSLFGPIAGKVGYAYPLKDFAIPDYDYDAIITDVAFACNTHLLNAQMAVHTSVWEYELADPDAPVASGPAVAGFSYGSPHSADLSYLFPSYNVAAFHPDGPPPLSSDQKVLRATIMDYWINLARHGDPAGPHSPAWPAFTAKAPAILSLAPPRPAAAASFLADHRCGLWKAILLAKAGLPANSPY